MKLKIMTLNLRCDTATDGINDFVNRRQNILNVIASESPELIGFQEATDNMRVFLRDKLTDYNVIGCGRDAGYTGEASCIAYKKQAFELISFETQLLSLEPHVSGTRHSWSDQSEYARIFVHAELKHKSIDNVIHFFNTHLDHTGEQAKALGMAQILQAASRCRGTLIITGDLNSYAGSAVSRMPMALTEHHMCECTKDVTHTFHGYGKFTEGKKIDYVFTDGVTDSCYVVDDHCTNGSYISDHFPVCAVLDL